MPYLRHLSDVRAYLRERISSQLIMEKEIEMFNEDYARVNNDYRREMLSRSWSQAKSGSPRRFLPHLPGTRRARRAA